MGGKKVKGRKRHIATDTLGNMLTVQVHAANIADTSQGWDVCDQVAEKYDSIEAFSGDQGYSGTTVEFVENLLGLRIDIAAKQPHGFKVILKRQGAAKRLVPSSYGTPPAPIVDCYHGDGLSHTPKKEK